MHICNGSKQYVEFTQIDTLYWRVSFVSRICRFFVARKTWPTKWNIINNDIIQTYRGENLCDNKIRNEKFEKDL